MTQIKNKKMENSAGLSSWTKAETLLLIKEVKKHPVLYKLNHPDHLSNKCRRQALLAILNTLKPLKPDVTEDQIKTKIRTFRHQMASEKKRITDAKEKEGGNAVYVKPTLWCYHELSYMMDDDDETTSFNATKLRNLRVKEAAFDNEIKTCQCTIKKSTEILRKLTTNTMASKEVAFCNYLSTELKTLKCEESFDEFKMSIMVLLQSIKAKEKKTLAEGKFVWRDFPSPAPAAKHKRKTSPSNDSILEDTVQSSNYGFDEEINIKCEPDLDP